MKKQGKKFKDNTLDTIKEFNDNVYNGLNYKINEIIPYKLNQKMKLRYYYLFNGDLKICDNNIIIPDVIINLVKNFICCYAKYWKKNWIKWINESQNVVRFLLSWLIMGSLWLTISFEFLFGKKW